MMGWRDIVAERFEKEIVLHALRILCMRIQNAPLIVADFMSCHQTALMSCL